jgi:hypothetical protein
MPFCIMLHNALKSRNVVGWKQVTWQPSNLFFCWPPLQSAVAPQLLLGSLKSLLPLWRLWLQLWILCQNFQLFTPRLTFFLWRSGSNAKAFHASYIDHHFAYSQTVRKSENSAGVLVMKISHVMFGTRIAMYVCVYKRMALTRRIVRKNSKVTIQKNNTQHERLWGNKTIKYRDRSAKEFCF